MPDLHNLIFSKYPTNQIILYPTDFNQQCCIQKKKDIFTDFLVCGRLARSYYACMGCKKKCDDNNNNVARRGNDDDGAMNYAYTYTCSETSSVSVWLCRTLPEDMYTITSEVYWERKRGEKKQKIMCRNTDRWTCRRRDEGGGGISNGSRRMAAESSGGERRNNAVGMRYCRYLPISATTCVKNNNKRKQKSSARPRYMVRAEERAREGGQRTVENRSSGRAPAVYRAIRTTPPPTSPGHHYSGTRKSSSLGENLTGVKRHADFPRDLLRAAALSPA